MYAHDNARHATVVYHFTLEGGCNGDTVCEPALLAACLNRLTSLFQCAICFWVPGSSVFC